MQGSPKYCNLTMLQFEDQNSRTKFIHTLMACQTCTMSVSQFGTRTIVFTLSSRGNFNNFGCQNLRRRLLGGIFNKYQMLLGDFFLLRLPLHTLVAPTCWAQFSPAAELALKISISGFQKRILETLKSICQKYFENIWLFFHLCNQFPRLLGLVQLHLCLQLLYKCNCELWFHLR